jgi:hypothetical protein
MFLALTEQLTPYLLAQGPERIELLEVELRAAVQPGSRIFANHSARRPGA